MQIFRKALLLTTLSLGLVSQAFGYGPGRDYEDSAYLGAGVVNDLLGASIEVANPIGSVWVLVGEHVDVPSQADFEKGDSFGFAAGIRVFSGGRGLTSSWYGAIIGGTLDVDSRRENGNRTAYQRLGVGGTLGYQFISSRLRWGLGLGAAYLESYNAADEVDVDQEYVPLIEGTLSLRF